MKYTVTMQLTTDIAFQKSIALEQMNTRRSTVVLKNDGQTLAVTIHAQDAVALRASLNNILKPLQMYEELDNDY